jgi:hypothetical protein
MGAKQGHHPPYRAQSALAGQTHGQSEEPEERAGWNVDYLETVIRQTA